MNESKLEKEENDIRLMCQDVQRIPRDMDSQMAILEEKFHEFIKLTDNKIETWITTALGNTPHGDVKENCNVTATCKNCAALRSNLDTALKMTAEKEKESVTLQKQLDHKDDSNKDLMNQVKSLSDELKEKDLHISLLKQKKRPGYEAKIAQLELNTSKQNLQLSALQEQNNMLAAENKIKEKIVASKQNELQKTIDMLKKYQNNGANEIISTSVQERKLHSELMKLSRDKEDYLFGDIIVIHDLMNKKFNCNLVKNTNISVKDVFAFSLSDAVEILNDIQTHPRLVLLHTGSNDIKMMNDEHLVEYILQIYNILRPRDIKLAWSSYVPRSADILLSTKAYVINKKVEKELQGKPGVHVIKNNDFYLRDMLHPKVLDVLAEDDVIVDDDDVEMLIT